MIQSAYKIYVSSLLIYIGVLIPIIVLLISSSKEILSLLFCNDSSYEILTTTNPRITAGSSFSSTANRLVNFSQFNYLSEYSLSELYHSDESIYTQKYFALTDAEVAVKK